MGFKIVSRYQRINFIYFKTLNDAIIFWITTIKVNVENTKITENISIIVSVSYKSNKGIRLT